MATGEELTDQKIKESQERQAALAKKALAEGVSEEDIARVTRTDVGFYSEAPENTEELYSEVDDIPPDENRRLNDSLDAAMQASSVGQEPRDVFQELYNNVAYDAEDRDSITSRNIGNSITQQEERVKTSLEGGQPVDIAIEQASREEFLSVYDQTFTEARAYLNSLPSFKKLSPEVKEGAVFLQALKGLSSKVMDETGLGTRALDFTAMVAIPHENLRMQELAKYIGAEHTGMDLLDTTEFTSELVNQLLAEDPEARKQLTATIVDSWKEISGNNRLMLASFLNELSGDFSEDWKHVENVIERIDQTGLTLGAGRLIKGGMKAANLLKVAAETRNAEGMADAVEASLKGELTQAGVSPLDGADSIIPTADTGTLVKGSDDRLADEVRSIEAQNQIFLDEIDKVNNFGLALNSKEQASARQRAFDSFEALPGMKEFRVDEVDDLNFKIAYKVGDEEVEEVRPYLRKDVGGFESDGVHGYTSLDVGATSPNFRFKADKKSLVQLPEQMQMQGAKIRSLYDGAIKRSLGKLDKKQMKKVDETLLKGDEFRDENGQMVGREFSKVELVDQGVDGLKLSEKEYVAYKGIRQVVDHMYWAKNKELLNDWRARNVKLVEWSGITLPTKAYNSVLDANNGFRQTASRSKQAVVHTPLGRKEIIPAEEVASRIDDLYTDGYVLTKADRNTLFANGEDNLEWAFIPRDSLKEPSGMLLNRREGYMPKIRKDANYFLKEKVAMKIGGVEHETLKTVRYFDNKKDADTYREGLGVEAENYVIRADREMSFSELDDDYVNIAGGLFTGARKSTEIPFGLDDAPGVRIDALGGLQRYVNNLAKNFPMSLYRVGMQQRWINHAKALGALPGNVTQGFDEAVSVLDTSHESFKFLKDTHNQISFVTGVPTKAEQEMAGKIRNFSQMLEGIPGLGKPLARWVLTTSPDKLAGTARGLTFHMMLGMYNPAQFVIQASGSLVALSINPIHGAKAISQMTSAGIVDLAKGTPAKLKAFKKELAGKGLLDEEAYDAWNRSGMREAVTHTNLDYHSLWNDVPYDSGAFRRLVGNGDLFFKHGELVNSRISFFTAYNRWKELNPKLKVDDEALKDIIGRAENYRLNMSRMNAPKFQKGLMSVPTQFQQVNTKFFEKLFGSDFTKIERARLVAAQAALFGAAGVPLVSTLAPHVFETAGIDIETTDADTLQRLHNGVAGWVIQDYFDINSVITGRMTLGTDFIEGILAGPFESAVISELVLGPFNEVFNRSITAYDRITTAFSIYASGEDMTSEDFAGVSKILVKSLAQLPSSTANLVKAYDMTHSKFYKNKRGGAVFEWADKNIQTIIAQALGFSPQEVTDWYELNNRDGGQIPGSVKNTEADRIVWLLGEMENQSEESSKRWHGAAVNSILTKYERPQDRKEIIEKVKRRLKEPRNAKNEQTLKLLTNLHSEMQEGLAEIHKHAKIMTSPALARRLEEAGVELEEE